MDEPLKQRLVGALVVGAFAVIVVPWLLGDPEPPPARREVSAPAPPPPPTPPSTPRQTPPVAKPAPLTPSVPLPGVDRPRPVVDEDRAPAADVPEPVRVADTPPAGLFQVQAATFSSQDNAARLVERLRAAGLDARIGQSDKFWRVYLVGFDTRDAADGARARLQLEFSLSGVIQTVEP